MFGTYKSTGGESWGGVARITRGDDSLAAVIRDANPGLSEPLPPGAVLQIPKADNAPGLRGGELEIQVDGAVGDVSLDIADGFSLTYSIDGISRGRFDVPNASLMRRLFVPLTNQRIIVGASGSLVATGFCRSPQYSADAMTIEFMSQCQTAEGSMCPISAYPLEFEGYNIKEIAEYLSAPLGIEVSFLSDAGARFDRVNIDEETPLLAFLSDLAAQRNLVVTSGADGKLVFWSEISTGKPVATISADSFPYVDSGIDINEDEYYSSVTGIVEANPRKRKKAQSFTVKNPYAKINKPYTFTSRDSDDGELELAVSTMSARMFGGVVAVSLDVSTWRDDSGELWQPNTTILFSNPQLGIEEPFEFTISDVTLTKNATEKGANLTLTLPGSFGGKIPESLPWT